VDIVDPLVSEHAEALAKVLDIARWPHHCFVTRRATEDMVKARITKEGVLEAIREHILGGKPIYQLVQKSTGLSSYVFLPCIVDARALYVKVQLSAAASERDESLVIISSHPPEYPPPGASK